MVEALTSIPLSFKVSKIIIYTVDATPAKDIFRNVEVKFGIELPPADSSPVSFVVVSRPDLIDPGSYLRFTMFRQMMGGYRLMRMFLEEAESSGLPPPTVFIDTTGCSFTFPLLPRSCLVIPYVHYPTISSDMFSLVYSRRPSYNNSASVAQSRIMAFVKLLYFAAFALCYHVTGRLAHRAMCNSDWTRAHLSYVWRRPKALVTLHPPCGCEALAKLPGGGREPIVLSIGQFRPEKDHPLQLRSFKRLLEMRKGRKKVPKKTRLVLLGSCRGSEDEARVSSLRALASSLKISDRVDFVTNQPYSVLLSYLGRSSVGLHTMWNEHFGIGVVEMMAAGLLTVAHDSGGPRDDIIGPTLGAGGEEAGRLAGTEEEYAEAMFEALVGGGGEGIRERGRARSMKFDDGVFARRFVELFEEWTN